MSFSPLAPPRCLQFVSVRAIPLAHAGLPADLSFNAYGLDCKCGCDVWRVHGYWLADVKQFDDPLEVECCRCRALLSLFDSERDGYDAEIGGIHRQSAVRSKNVWRCPRCNSSDGPLIAAFGYQFEPFRPDEPEARRAQDFFDAFLLRHICATSRDIVEVATFECA